MGQVNRLKLFTDRSQLFNKCAKLGGQRISGQIYLDNHTFRELFQCTFGACQFLGSQGVSAGCVRHENFNSIDDGYHVLFICRGGRKARPYISDRVVSSILPNNVMVLWITTI